MRTLIRMTSQLALQAVLWAPLGAQQAKPGDLQASATGPTTVSLTWTAVPGSNGYVVQRAIGSNAFDRLTPLKLSGTTYTDATAPAASALRYRIRTVYPNNGQATLSNIVSVTTPSAPAPTASAGPPASPPPGQPTTSPSTPAVSTPAVSAPRATASVGSPVLTALTPSSIAPSGGRSRMTLGAVIPAAPVPADPTGFTSALQGNKVTLSWQVVPGVAWYLVGGPGMGPNGREVQGTSHTFDSPGPGQHEWTVASLAGQGQGPVNNGLNWPKAQLTVAPEVVRSGRYRVTMIGFSVDEQTLDDFWNWDGKGDEVYLAAYVGLKDRRNGTIGQRGHVRTVVYGDVNNLTGRILAGSLSNLGGLKTGDSYPDRAGTVLPAAGPEPDRIPLLVWEGPLTDGAEQLVLAPAVWESDQKEGPYIAWWQKLDQVISDVFADNAVAADAGTSDLHPVLARELDLGIPGPGVDRPLGMRPVGASIGWVRQQVVVITREKIEASLASPYRVGGRPVGVIPVSLVDYTAEKAGLRGAYTVYLRFERIP